MAADLSEDIVELKHFLSQAKRPRIQALLSAELQSLERAQQAAASEHEVKVAPLSKSSAVPEIRYTTLSSFSWEQDSEKVKIYVSVEGSSEEKLVANFQQWSFDVKIHDVQGKNLRCGVVKLNKAIVPEKCSVVVKPKRIIINLVKAEKGNWMDLYFKEDKFKPKASTKQDPMAGLMDLMKNMYEEGDEEMKKTIAKAWSEAQSGKKPDPLKGLDNDF